MKNALKKYTSLLCACLLLSATAASASAAIDESALCDGFTVVSTEQFTLANGVSETFFQLNNPDEDAPKRCYAVEIDLHNSDVSVVSGYNDGDADEWKMRSVRTQAEHIAAKHQTAVVCSINGSFYNTATGEPKGLLVMTGTNYHAAKGYPYFAILKDGTAVIRDGSVSAADVAEGVGGGRILVKNGVSLAPAADREPRCAVGIKENGNVVFFVGDGRQLNSVGHSYVELANIMIALGCTQAIEMDGGGSATMLTHRSDESGLTLHHVPSLGSERKVSSSLHVCVSKAATGNQISVSDSSSLASLPDASSIAVHKNTSIRSAKTGINFSYATHADGSIALAAQLLTTGMTLVLENSGKKTDSKTVIVPGDVDCDGQVSASDARVTLRASVSLEKLGTAAGKAADADADGKISASDARLILRASVHLTDSSQWL